MAEEWQPPEPPRRRWRWVVAAAVGVVAVAGLVRVDAGDGSTLEVEADEEEPPQPTPSPTPGPTPTATDEPFAFPDPRDTEAPDTAPEPGADVDSLGGDWVELAATDGVERDGAPVVWTGEQGLVWGGERSLGEPTPYTRRTFFDDGLAVQPADGSTTPLAASPLEARSGHVAVWTGSELVVWGGTGAAAYLDDGAAYDPEADTWRRIAAGPLSPRAHALGVWSGDELLVLGGADMRGPLDDGAAYDPRLDRWRPIADLPRPLLPFRPHLEGEVAVWAGGRLLVPVPPAPDHPDRIVLAYDPATDVWEELAAPDLPRQEPFAPGLVVDDDGGLFAVARTSRQRPVAWQREAGEWAALPDPPRADAWPEQWQPAALATWTDHGLTIFAGGGHGLAFDPDAGAWEALPPSPLPELWRAQLAWTGEGLLVWAPYPHPRLGAFGQEALAPVLWRPPAD